VTDNQFDETFEWLEDVELSYRLASNGNEMVFVEDALVEHPHPESFWSYLMRKFHYASCAPEIYRRYPDKAFSDSRTPRSRKLQLLLLGLAGLGFGVWGLVGILQSLKIVESGGVSFLPWLIIASSLGSVAFSLPVVVRAFRKSAMLGMISPFFVLSGNVAFVFGSLYGLARRTSR
jgi:hypothetical protein